MAGAQQRLVFPAEDTVMEDSTDPTDIAALLTGDEGAGYGNHSIYNPKLDFALQTPLLLLWFAVATFLAGLFSVVFSPLGSSLEWGDDAKVV